MIDRNDVTFVIPIFNLVDARLNNLKFILPYILSTGCEVLVVEQVSTNNSLLKDMLSSLVAEQYAKNFKHLLYLHDNKLIHKSGIINWATKNHVDTKYVWVNDADFYMKYNDVFHTLWNSAFIQPYQAAKKLNKENSNELLHGKKLNVDFSDEESMYISLYGALSFIFEKSAFLELGGMDENLFGWGQEDIELSNRLKENRKEIQILEFKGIHLWHPISESPVADNECKKDMAIVTCHFNWCGYTTPENNLKEFLVRMRDRGVPVYGVELSLTDRFVTSGIQNWKQIKVDTTNVCFQKEACVNLIVKEIPKNYTKIAWIDGDIEFTNKKWYNETSKKLDTYKIVQMYERGFELERDGRITKKYIGHIFSTMSGELGVGKQRVVPGGAWAARRELWENGGLYPYCIVGGGDTVLTFALLGDKIPDIFELGDKNLTLDERYYNWRSKVKKYVDDSISYVGGDFIHHWHGDKQNRQYTERQNIIRSISSNCIQLNSKGIVEIVGVKNKIYDDIRKYFEARKEDGEVVSSSLSTSYDYCTVITTHNRPEMLKMLLDDIKRLSEYKKVFTVVFDDASTEYYNLMGYDCQHVVFSKNQGKQKFWKIINETFKYVKEIDAKYYFYLQDDVRLTSNFFEKAIHTYNSINDPKKISLGTLIAESQKNVPNWTNVEPILVGNCYKTQWCELFFVAEKKFFEVLDYQIYPIGASRWKGRPHLGSGVGQQMSKRLLHSGHNMYHVVSSLVSHGDHDSHMNFEHRKQAKLVAVTDI